MADNIEDEVTLNFPKKPIGGDSPYFCCAQCGVSVPEINGRLEGHKDWCPWRKWVESRRRTIQIKDQLEKEVQTNVKLGLMLQQAEEANADLAEANSFMGGVLEDLTKIAGVTDVGGLVAWAEQQATQGDG